MFGKARPPIDDETFHWMVNFNSDVRCIELHASCTLAAFRAEVSL